MGGSEDWTEPGAFAVAPGVHRIPLPLPSDGLRAVNTYAVDSGEGLVLVDGGWALAASRRRLDAALATLGRHARDITHVFVTHIHRDHYTQAVGLRREFGTRVALGSGERASMAALQGPAERSLAAQVRQLRTCGAGAVVERLAAAGYGAPVDPSAWEPPDDWLVARATLPVEGRDLLVLPTPGHTAGHVCFADLGAGLLFAGDHVLPHITPSIGFEPVPAHLPLRAYLHSLALLRRLPDLRLLPAHGPVTASTHERIDELLAHHDARLEACLDAVAAGAATAFEAARALPWTRRARRFDDLDPFNQMLATTETAAHLELLAARGRLEAGGGSDGVVRYRPPAPARARA